MEIYRTPDDAFADIDDFPFAPHYAELSSGLRVHYVDEGPRDAPVVLMMHGEPTWSYLYRHMIAPTADAGLRVIAPDLIGFGKSDKPTAKSDYSYARQVAWMQEWVEKLDLQNITLVCQDWGSLIGLRLVAAMPDRFSGVVLSNGGLPTGQPAPRPFAIWRAFAKYSPIFPIAKIVQLGTKRQLSEAELAAYNAPFPNRVSKAAARVFPSFVPLGENIEVPAQEKAWKVLEQWNKPFLCCFADGDPITRGGEQQFIERVPGAKGQAHIKLKGGHFIQEDDPQGFVAQILTLANRPG